MSTQQIQGRDIVDGTIGTNQLGDNIVTSAKIANGAVGTTQLATNAVTAAILADNAVDTNAIQADAVTTAKIADDQITPAKLADGAVTPTKLADNAVTSVAIAGSAVTLGKIAVAAVDANALATNAVTSSKLLADAVTTVKIVDSAITGPKIAAGAITSSHLSIGDLHFAADTTSLTNKKVVFNLQLDSVSLTSGASADISSSLSSETAVTSASSSEGVIVDTPKNRCTLRDVNFAPIVDGSSREVYGRLTFSLGVWTLTYFVDISGVQTAFSLPVTYSNAHVMVPKRFNLNIAPEDSFRNAAQFTTSTAAIAAHIVQATGAHAASAISVADAGNHFTTDNVEAALQAIVGTSWVQGTSDSLNGHLVKVTGAHAGTAISFSANGSRTTPLTAINVNAAIEELHAEVETLQSSPTPVVFGFKYFLSLNGETVFSVVGATNAPFNEGDNSLEVFREGIIQSIDAGHYTEDPTGNFITFSTPTVANEDIILRWFK